jgi:hypothetical protein
VILADVQLEDGEVVEAEPSPSMIRSPAIWCRMTPVMLVSSKPMPILFLPVAVSSCERRPAAATAVPRAVGITCQQHSAAPCRRAMAGMQVM